MAYQNDDLLAFRQLRAQAARKKQLETQRAALTDRCQVLSVRRKPAGRPGKPRNRRWPPWNPKGPMGLLYTIAGDKAKRLDEARQTLRKAQADDQQASWDLAQAQVDLAQTERSLEPLAGCDSAFAAARQAGPQPSKPLTCPKAASCVSWKRPLPRGRLVPTSHRSVRPVPYRPGRGPANPPSGRARGTVSHPSTLALLQDAADLTVQQQQKLDQNLTALLTGMEERQTQLEQTLDDLLAQDLFPSPWKKRFLTDQ